MEQKTKKEVSALAAHQERDPEQKAPTEYSIEVKHRINRNLGHLARVKKMIDSGDDFSRVMIQLAAVRAALSSTANELMRSEMDQALLEAHETENTERLDNAFSSMRKYFSK